MQKVARARSLVLVHTMTGKQSIPATMMQFQSGTVSMIPVRWMGYILLVRIVDMRWHSLVSMYPHHMDSRMRVQSRSRMYRHRTAGSRPSPSRASMRRRNMHRMRSTQWMSRVGLEYSRYRLMSQCRRHSRRRYQRDKRNRSAQTERQRTDRPHTAHMRFVGAATAPYPPHMRGRRWSESHFHRSRPHKANRQTDQAESYMCRVRMLCRSVRRRRLLVANTHLSCMADMRWPRSMRHSSLMGTPYSWPDQSNPGRSQQRMIDTLQQCQPNMCLPGMAHMRVCTRRWSAVRHSESVERLD